MVAGCLTLLLVCGAQSAAAQEDTWKDGGPKYIYVKPGKKPARHMPYDKELKCIDCHKWNGVDAYTAATMTLKKSVTGRLPRSEIRAAIVDALKGAGNYREMYVLSTAFNNQPLGTCIEFTLNPATLTLYASSEKQTEKLFHVAANEKVCLVYVRTRADRKYFIDPLGVQIGPLLGSLQKLSPELAALDVPLGQILLLRANLASFETRTCYGAEQWRGRRIPDSVGL